MQIDPTILEEFGIDQETFDRLRTTTPGFGAYTREEFRALDESALLADQCRASLARTVAQRITNGFYHRHRPVLDDLPHRAFQTMAEYREWCQRSLPGHLGFRRPS